MSPSFTLNPGDVKMVHHLRSGGKLVIQKKKNGREFTFNSLQFYRINCVSRGVGPVPVTFGLRSEGCLRWQEVFLEKTKENAVLSLTDAQGHSIKTLACEF
ncbi:hypothetical protein OSTOST_22861 [Ostertagia ostertagi]